MNVVKQPLPFLAVIGFILLIYQWQKRDALDIATDYRIYYTAAEHFRSDPSTLYNAATAGFDQYLYPPPAIALFVVCTFLPYQLSYWFFVVIMYASLIGGILIWQRIGNPKFDTLHKRDNNWFIALAVTSAPMFHNITLGQINCLVLLLCMLYLHFAEKRPVLAGIFLAAACWIKVYPVVLALWSVFSKERRKSLYAFVIASASVVPLMAFFIPFQLYFDFAEKLIQLSHYSCSNPINQSVTAFFLRFNVPLEKIFIWPNVYLVPDWIRTLNYALLIAVLVGTCIQLYKHPNKLSIAAVLLGFIPLFSPLGWGHSFVFALPLIMLCMHALQKSLGRTWIGFAVVSGIGFLLLIPVYNAPGVLQKLPFFLQNLYYSRLGVITTLGIIMVFVAVRRYGILNGLHGQSPAGQLSEDMNAPTFTKKDLGEKPTLVQ